MRFKSLVPMLQTREIEKTRAWYETVLGFTCEEQAEGWCRLTRDGATIMFMNNDHLGEPHATATQYFYVDDAPSVWAALKDNCEAEWGPEKMPYGMTEFAIKDPNGYLLSFGSPTA
ncbi:bleomycin resistance family protein [Terrihabitans soli]|uniref:Bleomycin resistance family protein n=1 Tax=Terrihabitans soli TaxID=708113 RepID=A0A6S6QSA1_9HYPH|nr:VOC family protein [Terrihabitans soli]BCJ89338.1 bleomycin resistance family protein [Terrihabitans soli]